MKINKISRSIDGEYINCQFEHNNKKGWFSYLLVTDNSGIMDCEYNEEDEDIYQEIHDWIEKHIRFKIIILYNDKELKK